MLTEDWGLTPVVEAGRAASKLEDAGMAEVVTLVMGRVEPEGRMRSRSKWGAGNWSRGNR